MGACKIFEQKYVYYRGTSLIRKRHPVGPYSRAMPRDLWGSQGGLRFLMSEVTLYLAHKKAPPTCDHQRALGIGLLWDPGGRRFFVSKLRLRSNDYTMQGYLARKKIPTPLGSS